MITVPISCGSGGVSGSYLVQCNGVGECQCPNLGVEWRVSSVNVYERDGKRFNGPNLGWGERDHVAHA